MGLFCLTPSYLFSACAFKKTRAFQFSWQYCCAVVQRDKTWDVISNYCGSLILQILEAASAAQRISSVRWCGMLLLLTQHYCVC